MTTELLLLFFMGSLLPLVVELLTKWAAPDWVKNVVNVGLAALVVTIQQAVDALGAGEEFAWQSALTGFIVTWAASVFAYMKLWKNSPVIVAVGKVTSGVGFDGPLGPTSKPAPPPVMTSVSHVSQD